MRLQVAFARFGFKEDACISALCSSAIHEQESFGRLETVGAPLQHNFLSFQHHHTCRNPQQLLAFASCAAGHININAPAHIRSSCSHFALSCMTHAASAVPPGVAVESHRGIMSVQNVHCRHAVEPGEVEHPVAAAAAAADGADREARGRPAGEG